MRAISTNIWHNNQEEQLIKALNNSSLLSITDPKGTIIYVNDLFCKISGYKKNELVGNNHRMLKSGKQPDIIFKELWATISSNKIWKGQLCNKKKNGGYYWVDATIIPFLDTHGKIEKYVALRNDITKSKKIVENLNILKNKFNLIINSAPYAYFITDLKGNILICNKAAEKLSGYNYKELLSKKIYDSIKLTRIDRLFLIKTLKIPSKKPYNFEFQITTKQGKKIDVKLISHQAFIEGENIILNIAHDITKRNLTIKKLNQKTKDLELLLYRLGHDIKTPFTSFEGLLNLIKQKDHDENTLELLAMFEKVLKDGKKLIQNISDSSKMTNKPIKKEKVDLNELVHQTIASLNHFKGFKTVSFNVNIPKYFIIYSNHQLLKSVIQNLIQNAINNQRPLTKSHTPFVIINAFKEKEGIKISIKDNGFGINKNEIDKVFNLYYRGNQKNHESGLGLYITKNTVDQLNGTITLKSKLKRETQFDILLPNTSH